MMLPPRAPVAATSSTSNDDYDPKSPTAGNAKAERNDMHRKRAMAMHPSASHRKLKILVSADRDLNTVRILVHGCVTPLNLHGLDMVVRRAAALSPGTNVDLDLSEAQAPESLREDLHASSITARLASMMATPAEVHLYVIPPAYVVSPEG
ncbi:hypothetical protein [Arthrobacter subterraneus]|uniref:hypothetical protein n=1 Tax=Arthrobacter subterraneus TaxID=335973 RepID=UPI00380D6510